MSTPTTQRLTRGNEDNTPRFNGGASKRSTRELAQLAQKHITQPKTTSNVAVVVFAVLYIAMAIIGFLNLDNCPVRPEIPIWMIVAAFSSLLNIANHFYKLYKETHNQSYPLFVRILDGILLVFRPVWFIAGCVWVYTAYVDVTYETIDNENYCDQITYSTALVFSTVFCIIVVFILACLCCACCYVIFHDDSDSEDGNDDM
ncbi:unnamed protein product [Cylicocyclus nassatus]|uniref:Transmembrane protein n=1 Tax=Cylicocyclus nassatus TaxID=53992 RepID=A0AA36GZK6_CYLNA|nr:unnamed protein product [Cylicocyclus nassatus]